MENIVIEQYKELCNNARNIDGKLWAFPTSAFSFEAVTIQGYLIYPHFKIWIIAIGTLGFIGFFIQLARFRGY